jgi:hypothetical protein
MTHHPTVMPDFADRLDRDLRAEAARLVEDAPRPRRRARSALTLAGGLAVGGVAAVAVVSSLGHSSPAYAGPLIAKAPQAHAPQMAERLATGLTARNVLGADVRFDQVREIATPAGPAYAVGGAQGWCLTIPDAASPNPAVERGVACAETADFNRIGLSSRVGKQFIAVVPQGVRDPVLRRASGTTSDLVPSRYGAVSAAVGAGDTVTMFDTSGHPRRDRVSGP